MKLVRSIAFLSVCSLAACGLEPVDGQPPEPPAVASVQQAAVPGKRIAIELTSLTIGSKFAPTIEVSASSDGTAARRRPDGSFDFDVGTVSQLATCSGSNCPNGTYNLTTPTPTPTPSPSPFVTNMRRFFVKDVADPVPANVSFSIQLLLRPTPQTPPMSFTLMMPSVPFQFTINTTTGATSAGCFQDDVSRVGNEAPWGLCWTAHVINPPCVPTGLPDTNCDGVDDDCANGPDDAFPTTPTTCGVGACARTGAIACVNKEVKDTCVKGAPTPEVVGDGIDNDCDGFIDGDPCDGADNDASGLADDAAGSCVERYLFAAFCWGDHTQAEFDAAFNRWKNFHEQASRLTDCRETSARFGGKKFWFEAAPVGAIGCPLGPDGMLDQTQALANLRAAGVRFDLRQWDTLSLVTVESQSCAAGVFNGSGGLIGLESGGATPFKGEYVIFSHEYGHSLGQGEEYRVDSNRPNTVAAQWGCDPNVPLSTDPSACCGRTLQDPRCGSVLVGQVCLGNEALNLGSWQWGDPPASVWGDHSRCIMSNASAVGWDVATDPTTGDGSHRGWCQACWNNWDVKGPKCEHVYPGAVRRLSIVAQMPAPPMPAPPAPTPPMPGPRFSQFGVEVGRVGRAVLPTGGPTTFIVRTPGGSELARFAPPMQGFQPSVGARPTGFWVRVPVAATVSLPVVVTTQGGPIGPTKTTLGGGTPVARVSPVTAQCTSPAGASVTVNGSASSDPDGDTISFAWSTSAPAVALAPATSATPSGTFPVGTRNVTVTVSDGTGASSSATAAVTVVDTVAPQLTVPAAVAGAICGKGGQITVGQATATDACAGAAVIVRGQVVSTNGTTLAPPIDVVAGRVQLGVGTHVIRWTATDGFNTSQASQTVTVGTVIQAAQSFVLRDRAKLRAGAAAGALYSSGTALTEIGNEAGTADVVSVGPVSVLHAAVIEGDILSAGAITVAGDATVSGTTRTGAVTLPALPALQSFTVPSGAGIVVTTSRTFAPGSYPSITANSGSTVIFQGGDFFVGSLTINDNVTLRASATTRLFVKTDLILRSSFKASSGTQVQPLFLGFAGTAATLEAQFDGKLLAPAATMTFGSGPGIVYTGSFLAKGLDVRPGNSLACAQNVP